MVGFREAEREQDAGEDREGIRAERTVKAFHRESGPVAFLVFFVGAAETGVVAAELLAGGDGGFGRGGAFGKAFGFIGDRTVGGAPLPSLSPVNGERGLDGPGGLDAEQVFG